MGIAVIYLEIFSETNDNILKEILKGFLLERYESNFDIGDENFENLNIGPQYNPKVKEKK